MSASLGLSHLTNQEGRFTECKKTEDILVVIWIVYESFSLELLVLFVAVNFSSSFTEQPLSSWQGGSHQTTLCSDCPGEKGGQSLDIYLRVSCSH